MVNIQEVTDGRFRRAFPLQDTVQKRFIRDDPFHRTAVTNHTLDNFFQLESSKFT